MQFLGLIYNKHMSMHKTKNIKNHMNYT